MRQRSKIPPKKTTRTKASARSSVKPRTNVPRLRLEVDRVAYGNGKGVARHEGKVVFVDGAVAGDVVEAEVTSEKERFAEARAVRRIQDSPFREASRCAFSKDCGGCQWQGVSYEAQLEWKKGFVEQAFRGVLSQENAPEVEIVAAQHPQGYRSRIQVRCRADQDGVVSWGFFATGSRTLVPVTTCAITEPAINDFLKDFVEGGPYAELSSKSFRLELQLLAHDRQSLLVTVIPAFPSESEAFKDLIKAWSTDDRIVWAGLRQHIPDAPEVLFDRQVFRQAVPKDEWLADRQALDPDERQASCPDEHEGEVSYWTAAGQFQQIPLEMNRKLRQRVFETVVEFAPEEVLDLYCGNGNLSLSLAAHGIKVTGREWSQGSVKSAQRSLGSVNRATKSGSNNATKNAVKTSTSNAPSAVKADMQAEDCHAFLKGLSATKSRRFSVSIVDPPRQGMKGLCADLAEVSDRAIVYVGCDPMTMARDIEVICKKKFSLRSLVAMDFFPNTFHVETMAVLLRGSEGSAEL